MLRRLIAFAAILAPAAAALADGPFGVSMGDSVAQLRDCAADKAARPGIYTCKSLPKPHPAFERFIVISSKDVGICKVGAIGKSIPDSGEGDRTRAKVDEIANQIAATYGGWSEKFDFLHVGAVFKDEGYWLMAVEKDERTYSYIWRAGQLAEKNGVTSIILKAGATSHDSGFVTVQFEFANFAQCKEAMERAEASAF